ncbi:MAG: helix-turn-helix domain-containing protein [Planctomycetota bacterium]
MHRLSDYLTVAEAAEILGVSKDTLRRWDRSGKLSARRHPVTRYRLYLKKELEDLLRLLGGGSVKRSKGGSS